MFRKDFVCGQFVIATLYFRFENEAEAIAMANATLSGLAGNFFIKF